MHFCFMSGSPCTQAEAAAWLSAALVFLGVVITSAVSFVIYRGSVARLANARQLVAEQQKHDHDQTKRQQQSDLDVELFKANLALATQKRVLILARLRKFQSSAEHTEDRARPLTTLQATLAAVKGTPQEEEISATIINSVGSLLQAAGGVFAGVGQDDPHPHIPEHCESSLRKLRRAVIRVLLLLNFEPQTGQAAGAVHAQMNSAMIDLHKAIVAFKRVVAEEETRAISKEQIQNRETTDDAKPATT